MVAPRNCLQTSVAPCKPSWDWWWAHRVIIKTQISVSSALKRNTPDSHPWIHEGAFGQRLCFCELLHFHQGLVNLCWQCNRWSEVRVWSSRVCSCKVWNLTDKTQPHWPVNSTHSCGSMFPPVSFLSQVPWLQYCYQPGSPCFPVATEWAEWWAFIPVLRAPGRIQESYTPRDNPWLRYLIIRWLWSNNLNLNFFICILKIITSISLGGYED